MLIYHPTVLGFGKSAFFTRNATNPNWRQYEMAAISHLPEPILPLGLPNQNTADARPIFRAAFNNLTRWAHGKHRNQASRGSVLRGSRGRDRRVRPDDGCRRPLRGRPSTPSRRVGGPRPRCRRATRPTHAAQSSWARPVPPVRVHRWHVHPVRRRRAPRSIPFAAPVREARQARGRRSGSQAATSPTKTGRHSSLPPKTRCPFGTERDARRVPGNVRQFASLADAQPAIEAWRLDCRARRPGLSIGLRPGGR